MSRLQWNSLDTPDALVTLTSKLPGNARERWNRLVLKIRRHDQRGPELSGFINFIGDETLLSIDPPFSCEALREYTESKPVKVNMKRRLKTYAPHKEESRKVDSKHLKCPVCEGMLDLDLCKHFGNL